MIHGACVTAWKRKRKRKRRKEKRQLSRINVQTASHLHGMGQVGYGQALHCGVGTRWKRKIIGDCSQEPLCTMHISEPAFVYGFYPIAFKKHYNRNVENLNDPRSKQTANHLPSSSLAARTYEYNAHYITNSIVQYMLPPRANAQLRVYWTNNLEGPSQRHLDAPAILTWLSRYLMETTS
jgi:hypothetical protein